MAVAVESMAAGLESQDPELALQMDNRAFSCPLALLAFVMLLALRLLCSARLCCFLVLRVLFRRKKKKKKNLTPSRTN